MLYPAHSEFLFPTSVAQSVRKQARNMGQLSATTFAQRRVVVEKAGDASKGGAFITHALRILSREFAR